MRKLIHVLVALMLTFSFTACTNTMPAEETPVQEEDDIDGKKKKKKSSSGSKKSKRR